MGFLSRFSVPFTAVTPTMSVIPIDFDLAATVSESHIHARVRTVELTPEVTMSFLREVRNLMVDSRKMRVMLEFELAHTLNEARAYDVMTRCFGVMSGARVAFVNTDTRQHPSLTFCTQVSQEFGEDFGYFTDTGTAAEWLGES